MKRRAFIGLIGGAAVWPLAGRAQTRNQMKRIGVLFSAAEGNPQSVKDLAAFKSGLQALGWNEGANLQIDYRWGDGDPSRARSSAMELVSISPAVIMGTGTVAMIALHDATNIIPIVFLNVADPVASETLILATNEA